MAASLDVNLADAYAIACQALGESIVRERLLTNELTKLSLKVGESNA